MFFINLETERLFLKNISSEDRDFIFTEFSNEKVYRYLLDEEPLTDIQGADEIINIFLQPEPRTQHRWVIIKNDDDLKIGTCGFHCWDKLKGCCDIGYDLYPDFWNKGYMSEAIQAIITFARKNMEIKKINACIYPDNHASINLAEKCGFVFNGEMRDEIFRGQKYPHKIYTLDCTI